MKKTTTTLLIFSAFALNFNVSAQENVLTEKALEQTRIQIREGGISESSLNLIYSFSIEAIQIDESELLAFNTILKAKDIKMSDSKLNVYSEKELSTTAYATLKEWVKGKGINFDSLEKYYVLIGQ